MNDFDLNKMSPEQLQKLFSLSTAGDQNQIIADQVQQANALRLHKQPSAHSTAMGGLLGAIGDTIGAGAGGVHDFMLQKRQQQALQDQAAARQQFAQAMGLGGGAGPVNGSMHPGMLGSLGGPQHMGGAGAGPEQHDPFDSTDAASMQSASMHGAPEVPEQHDPFDSVPPQGALPAPPTRTIPRPRIPKLLDPNSQNPEASYVPLRYGSL